MCQGHVSSMGVTGSLRRSDHRVRYSIRRGSLRSVERTHQRGPAAGRRKVLTCLRGGEYIVASRSQTGRELHRYAHRPGRIDPFQLTAYLAP